MHLLSFVVEKCGLKRDRSGVPSLHIDNRNKQDPGFDPRRHESPHKVYPQAGAYYLQDNIYMPAFRSVVAISDRSFDIPDHSQVFAGTTDTEFIMPSPMEMNKYWIPCQGIHKRVITQELQYLLGPEATVRQYTRDVG
jgi:hypothetical protein